MTIYPASAASQDAVQQPIRSGTTDGQQAVSTASAGAREEESPGAGPAAVYAFALLALVGAIFYALS